MASIYDALLDPTGDAADTPEKAAALAAALKRQSAYGTLGQLMGVQPTQQVGASMRENAQGSLKMALGQRQAAREAASRKLEREQAQANWQAQMERDAARDAEARRQFGIQEARLSRNTENEWSSPIADPVNGGWIVVNKKDPTQFRRIDSQGGVVSNMGPVAGAPGSLDPLSGPTGKQPPEAQVKAGMQGAVSTDALRRANEIQKRDPSTAKPGVIETAASIFGLNPSTQQLATQLGGGAERGIVRTATEGAIDAALTSMTGAAYTAEQLAAYRGRFMPTILDNPDSIRTKQEDFMQFVRQQSVAAGNAWTPQREANLQALAREIIRVPGSEEARVNAPAQPNPAASSRDLEAEYADILGGQ